jgi:predicted nucleic acid-binding protein
MQKIIICDTSCLILLQKINELEILHLHFGKILTTIEVAIEFGEVLPDWISTQQPSTVNYNLLFETKLGRGESSAIALASEFSDCLLIIDDLKARKTAQKLGLKVIGTLGLLVDAKLKGNIPSIKPFLEKIKQTNFRISNQLENLLLDFANE